MKKILTLIIMLMFLLMTVSSANEIYLEKQTNQPMSMDDTLYVGGNGTGNYTKIQDAIKDSSDGDTVYVYDDSSPYCENIRVNKAINLIGEDKNTTEINGHLLDTVVIVKSDGVTVRGFTIMHSKHSHFYTGIEIYEASNVTISDNIITENEWGICVKGEYQTNYYTSNNIISDNIISSNNYIGIWLTRCNDSTISNNIIIDNIEMGIHSNYGFNNTISDNYISNNKNGITLFQISNNNIVSGNTITNNEFHGIYLRDANNQIISGNNIINNGFRGIWLSNADNTNISGNNIVNNSICGLTLEGSYRNDIFQNNFINNSVLNVRFVLYLTRILERNKWDGNYWDKPSNGIHMIYGKISFFGFIFGLLPWFCIDWHPANEPYDI